MPRTSGKSARRPPRKRQAPDDDNDDIGDEVSSFFGEGARASAQGSARKRVAGEHFLRYAAIKEQARAALAASGRAVELPEVAASLRCPACARALVSAVCAPDGETLCGACAQCAALPLAHTCTNWAMLDAVRAAIGEPAFDALAPCLAPAACAGDLLVLHNARASVCIETVREAAPGDCDAECALVVIRFAIVVQAGAPAGSLSALASSTDQLRAVLASMRDHMGGGSAAVWPSLPHTLGANEVGVTLIDARGAVMHATLERATPAWCLTRRDFARAPAYEAAPASNVFVEWHMAPLIADDVADDHAAVLAQARAWLHAAPVGVAGLDCVICCNSLTDARMAPCGHSVCGACAANASVRRCVVCKAAPDGPVVYATRNSAVAAAVRAALTPEQAGYEQLRVTGANGALGLACLALSTAPDAILPVCWASFANIDQLGRLAVPARIHAHCSAHFAAALALGRMPSASDRTAAFDAIAREWAACTVYMHADERAARPTRVTCGMHHTHSFCAMRLVGPRYCMSILVMFNTDFGL